ncbi:hypothetical protein [Sphingomonas sp.]|jgi:hypothetical protein|uniref:hypothetical protein n=1 Tax=Sphingomonas sp. TaxID=28214 RepID=UPI002E346FAE|nr:hypothetical protein [Sphingomonas sp.]HEX4693604.1 hypothetical protein [Sphingomonas sp.]
MTTLAEQVRGFVARLSPNPVCDGCVAERLGLTAPERANEAIRQLAGSDGFERRRDICSLCFGEKLVTRRR